MESKVFHFKDRPALRIQSNEDCRRLYDHFCDTVGKDDDSLFDDVRDDLFSVVESLRRVKDGVTVKWMAPYGCAILMKNLDVLSYQITVIGLNEWKDTVHSSVNKREATATANVLRPSILEIGIIKIVLYEDVMKKFHALMRQAQSTTTREKHHKTPSFVWARLLDAIVSVKALPGSTVAAMKESYQGGTTDVGLHTSCLQRNTSFPLVASVYCAMLSLYELDADHDSFRKSLCVYFLHHLRNVCGDVASFDRRKIDQGIVVIREIERFIFDVKCTKFQDRVVQEIESQHKVLRSLRPDIYSALCLTPKGFSLEDKNAAMKPPTFPTVSVGSKSTDYCTRMARAQAQAKKNLQWSNLMVYNRSQVSFQDALVALGRLNKEFWCYAQDLADSKKTYAIEDLKRKMEDHMLATQLAMKHSNECVNIMSVELRSCQMLVIWITFNWAHRIAKEKYPLFNGYSASLNPDDLCYLVLQEADAVEALKNVKLYLTEHRKTAKRPFVRPHDTLDLASAMGNASNQWASLVRSIYEAELSAAERKINERYKKIRKAQEQLRILDADLKQAKIKLKKAEADLSASRQRDRILGKYGQFVRYAFAYYQYKSAYNEAITRVNELQSQISILEKRPQDVFLPLPRNRAKAMQWLFLLFMPSEFINVLSLAHLGATQPWKERPPNTASPAQHLSTWYNSYKTTGQCPVSLDGKMELGSSTPAARSPLGHTDIRQYGRETGVFFPDAYVLVPNWTSTDPFSHIRSNDETARMFTEILPGNPSATMQSFVVMLPTRTRGNIGPATKNSKPGWLTHEEYEMFAALRAYPNAQLRKLLVAIVDELLPFDDPRVHVLVRQLLYHVGVSAWRRDFESGQVMHQVAQQLNQKAELLKDSPNNSGKLLFFGVVSAFFGQYNQRCLECARKFMAISRELGDGVDAEVRGREKISPDLYWKQAQLYGTALLSHSPRDLHIASLLELVELIVLFQYKSLFAPKALIGSRLQHALHFTMSRRISAIVTEVESNLAHLTRCLGLIVEDLPQELTWTKICYPDAASTACFEAQGEHHYSLNVLNGIVLVDGVPPGFLPSSVVRNPLFLRTFGPRNFECIVVDVDHYRTSRLIDGCFLYEFILKEDGLQIIEFDTLRDSDTLNATSLPLSWIFVPNSGSQQRSSTSSGRNPRDGLVLVPRERFGIPELLTEPYSHWYSHRHDAYLVRPPFYKERSVSSVITREGLYEVPTEDRAASLDALAGNLPSYDRLLFHGANALQVLARVEEPKFILPWVDSSLKSIRYAIPRLGLNFLQEDAAVQSLNFTGFSLRTNQTLDDTLIGIATYLVIADASGREMVLIPPGTVAEGGNISRRDEWNYKGECHAYDVHQRFHHLAAKDTLGRLQLACMHAASTCMIPEQRSMKTGSDTAVELVRQCWTNHQFSAEEEAKLVEVAKWSNLSCTLRLMCSWIWNCSSRLGFLRDETGAREALEAAPLGLELDPLAIREYRNSRHAQRMQPIEESRLLGTKLRHERPGPLEPPTGNEALLFVTSKEKCLKDACLIRRVHQDEKLPFPLAVPESASGVEQDFYKDLASSWDDHCAVPVFEVRHNPRLWADTLDDAKFERKLKERVILDKLTKHESLEFRLAVLSGKTKFACTFDLLRIILDPNLFEEVNPFLSADERSKLMIQIVVWMTLCVLEDKIRRIIRSTSSHEIVEELQAIRTWVPWEHIPWLAFEVEQGLQIRTYQYDVVNQLLQNPHSTIQLNMGLGKTSVLVPMLILEHINSGRLVVRINMLPALVTVVEDIYKRALTASAQYVRIMTLPFQRSFPLDEVHAKLLSEEMERSKSGRCCMLVTAQHRNSLLLKQHDQGILVEGIQMESLDIIDESDAILHQSFQLVYALGDQEHLLEGPVRWTMAEAFLTILSDSTCPEIALIRDDPSIVHSEDCGAGAFAGIRILPSFREHKLGMARALCKELIGNPPHEFLWMKKVEGNAIETLIDIMSNDQCQARDKIQANPTFSDKKGAILAARGCIAYGLLFHCLLARHRVNYGTAESRGKLAVPFSASDTPKARSDYSHPDVQIIYTCLSYFHSGLDKEQFEEALVCLQKLGPSAQDKHYSSWIASIRGGLTSTDDFVSFDCIRKVDMDNGAQLELMFQSLRKSMKVISFWMNNFVFPEETHVFPQRRVTSAWDLVTRGDKHNAVGFSGTEDNRKLLPRSITQMEHSIPELRATNGGMIDRILKCTHDVVLVNEEGSELWKKVLQKCVETRIHALIDVGGLMAGTKNPDAAVFLSEVLEQEQFRGVVYFNTSSNAWDVYEFQSKAHCRLQTSSLIAAECFAFYDESRCRGSDLKLLPTARALVTLEPGLTKDRFLQACARMRRLKPGEQSLILAGTIETLGSSRSVKDVLTLTIRNSSKVIEKGIMELYDRGMNHYRFPEPQDMDVSLDGLYGDAVKKYQSVGSFFDATIEDVTALSSEASTLVAYCRDIGEKANVKASQLSEECERELEEEEEQQEEEEEQEIEVLSPCAEFDWDFARAFSGAPLATKLFKVRYEVCLDIQWSCKLLCTGNFLASVTKTNSREFYMRQVDCFLSLGDGSIVLVSEYEADKLLPHWWKVQHSSPKVKLGHLALASSRIWLGGDEVKLPVFTRTSARLFRGYVNYEKDEREALGKLFVHGKARSSILKLLQRRHRVRYLDRSDLDEFSLVAGDMAQVGAGEDEETV